MQQCGMKAGQDNLLLEIVLWGGTGFALTGPWLHEQGQGQRRMERNADFLALGEAGQFLPSSVREVQSVKRG